MRIMIGGDISVCDSTPLFAARDARAAFGDLLDRFALADEVIVNLECAVTDKDTKISKFGPHLRAPFGTGATLKAAGITGCALSNNHIFDYGIAGLCDTIAELEANGLAYTGIGQNEQDTRRNWILTKDGCRVAIINVCEHEYSYALRNRMGARVYDPYDTSDDIMAAKKQADFVIVIYHGGKEHVRYPSPRLVKLCRSMVHHGADLVLCQHSHCIGCYETYAGGHILYGQGNFHFVRKEYAHGEAAARWNNGLLVDIRIDTSLTVDLIPVVVDGLGIREAHGAEKEAILADLAERNAHLQDGSWETRFHEFCKALSYYRFIPAEMADLFSHYLDCESHQDVWRELYPTWNQTNDV